MLMPCPSILVTLSSSLELLYRENSSAEFSLKEDHRQRTIIDKDKKLSHVAVLTEPCRVYTNLAVACVHHHTRTVCPNYFCSPKRKKIEKNPDQMKNKSWAIARTLTGSDPSTSLTVDWSKQYRRYDIPLPTLLQLELLL